MQPTTRLRILEYLRTHQTATAVELEHSLGMTGANIRHHLQILESNDLIELVGKRQVGRGRPDNVFGLSRQMLGDGLDILSDALCVALLKNLPPGNQEAVLIKTARIMAGTGSEDSEIPLRERLPKAVDHLNKMHYTARWEAAAGGPRIILGHCPYAAIIESHPELCLLDEKLLNVLTGLPLTQTAKLLVNSKGLTQCVFQAGKEPIKNSG
jgi:predicted ArsR family transcriptional regulator